MPVFGLGIFLAHAYANLILMKNSGLELNKEFFVGYSQEFIVSGDKMDKLTTIMKLTSNSLSKIAKEVDQLYKTII